MKNSYQFLFDDAHAAGVKAAAATTPTPMVVGTSTTPFSNDIDYSQPTYYVEGGVCGFAWVNVKPGTSAFAKWLKTKGLARTDSYYGGVSMSVREYGQSMERKEAYAGAFAERLRAGGINAYMMSRMD